MTDRLAAALSDCLHHLESGADVETCLARHPDLAADLRPLLFASAQARSVAVEAIPPEVARRARARVLNAAAEMREQRVAQPRPFFQWTARLSRLALAALVVMAFMLTGGAGLVSASSGALPGDQLYPLKRGWEGLRLLLAFDPVARETLEKIYEEERVREIGQLFSTGREHDVEFYGIITARTQTGWIVNQVIVQVVPQTRLDGALSVGAYVEVEGRTDASGVVIAERIRLREPAENDDSYSGAGGDPDEKPRTPAAPSYEAETPEPEQTGQPEPTRTPEVLRFEFEGIVQSMNGSQWRVSGQDINVSDAELRGSITVGALVRVRGEIIAGAWRATRVELRSAGGASSASSSSAPKDGGDHSSQSGSSSTDSASSTSSSSTSSSSDDDSGGGSSSSKSDDN